MRGPRRRGLAGHSPRGGLGAAALFVGGLLLELAAPGCASPPPPPREDTALLARIAALETKLEDSERARTALLLRVAAVEAATGRARPADGSVDAARLGALEARTSSIEERLAQAEGRPLPGPPPAGEGERHSGPPPLGEGERHTGGPPASPLKVVDRRAGPASAPAPGESVRALAALSGERFSFARDHSLDLARLIGLEAPRKAEDYARDPEVRRRHAEAWGEAAVSSDDAWGRTKERLEALILSGELSFEYDASHEERREPDGKHALLVYARVGASAGESVSVNETLVREGLALAHGAHGRAADMERLEQEARKAKRGLFAGR